MGVSLERQRGIKKGHGDDHAACTWLLSDVTPSLTRLLDAVDAVLPIELTESWLPLLSRDRPPYLLLIDARRGVAVGIGPRGLHTLWTGANNPYKGLQSKYLK